MNSRLSTRLDVMQNALLAGSVPLLKYFPLTAEEVKTVHKIDATPRTLIDTEAQRAILETIVSNNVFNNFLVHAEESDDLKDHPIAGLEYRPDLEGYLVHPNKTPTFPIGSRVLFIDPFDGTSNQQIRSPMSSMGIGITENDEYVASAILLPFGYPTPQMLYAEKDKGAYAIDLGRSMDVESVGLTRLKFDDSKSIYLFPLEKTEKQIYTDTKSNNAKVRFAWVDGLFREKNMERKLSWMREIVRSGLAQNIRIGGSNIHYSGQLALGNGHYQFTDCVGGHYDLCGAIILREAGGGMINVDGKEVRNGDQVAYGYANPADLPTLLEINSKTHAQYSGFQ